jgi:hypothetical protein
VRSTRGICVRVSALADGETALQGGGKAWVTQDVTQDYVADPRHARDRWDFHMADQTRPCRRQCGIALSAPRIARQPSPGSIGGIFRPRIEGDGGSRSGPMDRVNNRFKVRKALRR